MLLFDVLFSLIDQWIPRKSGLKVATFKRRSRLRWVNQLLTPEGNEWNGDLVKELFHEFDVEEICKIKLPNTEVEDCVAWHSEKNGVFTVRSAYKLGSQLKQQMGAAASSSVRDADNRSIWDRSKS